MSSFWSGVIGAIIGAVVGGAFTAWAGWWQSRGAYRAAAMQIGETLRIERELQRETLRQRAAMELLGVNSDIWACTYRVADDHPDGEHECPKGYQPPAELRPAVRTMSRLYSVYDAILPVDVRRVAISLLDLAEELTRPDPMHAGFGDCKGRDSCDMCTWCCVSRAIFSLGDAFGRDVRKILIGSP